MYRIVHNLCNFIRKRTKNYIFYLYILYKNSIFAAFFRINVHETHISLYSCFVGNAAAACGGTVFPIYQFQQWSAR